MIQIPSSSRYGYAKVEGPELKLKETYDSEATQSFVISFYTDSQRSKLVSRPEEYTGPPDSALTMCGVALS